MRLYLLRHADAVNGLDDDVRELSALGRKQARRLGEFLAHGGIGFDTAFSSPLVRAQETARLVVRECGRIEPGQIETTAALLNETTDTAFERLCRGLPHAHHVLFVGHAPTLAERAERLLHLPGTGGFKLGKGAMICVDWEPGRAPATLKFFLTQNVLGVKGQLMQIEQPKKNTIKQQDNNY